MCPVLFSGGRGMGSPTLDLRQRHHWSPQLGAPGETLVLGVTFKCAQVEQTENPKLESL